MNQLEHVGTLYIENQRLLEEYQKLLILLQRAKDGEVQLSQIQIDLANAKWAIVVDAADLKVTAADE